MGTTVVLFASLTMLTGRNWDRKRKTWFNFPYTLVLKHHRNTKIEEDDMYLYIRTSECSCQEKEI